MRWVAILLCVLLQGCGQFEGFSLTPYKDPVQATTVCHGHKVTNHARKVYTEQECQAIWIADTAKALGAVYQCSEVVSIGQVIAFTDLAYNLGGTRFCRSSPARLSRQGLFLESCRDLNRYVNGGGRRLGGLVKRRAYYSEICKGWRWRV